MSEDATYQPDDEATVTNLGVYAPEGHWANDAKFAESVVFDEPVILPAERKKASPPPEGDEEA